MLGTALSFPKHFYSFSPSTESPLLLEINLLWWNTGKAKEVGTHFLRLQDNAQLLSSEVTRAERLVTLVSRKHLSHLILVFTSSKSTRYF